MNRLKVNFQVKYIVIFLSLIVIVGIILFFTMSKYNIGFKFTDIIAYAAGSVAIMALIYHALSLESQYKFHQENLFLTRSQYAYEVISKFNEPHMSTSLLFLNKIEEKPNEYFPDKKVQKYLDYIKENPKDRQKMIMIINYYEHLSILIKNNHIEESIVKNNFKTIFVDTFIMMKPYIDHCQLHSASIWCNYEKLATKWNS
jgi:hypothetical protein